MKVLNKEELVSVLKNMIERIEADDSYEGNITYLMGKPFTFEVQSAYRIGNREGQGGWRMIGNE